MSEHSIFGETGGADRREGPPAAADVKRTNPTHGLFGARLLSEEDGGRDKGPLPQSRD